MKTLLTMKIQTKKMERKKTTLLQIHQQESLTGVTAPVFQNTRPSLKIAWPLQNLISEKDMEAIIAGTLEKERKLIGQELHDNVNQILTAAKLFMEMLRPDDIRERNIREKSIEYIMMAIEEIRKISRELIVPGNKEKGLTDAIKTMIDDIHFSTSMKIKFNCYGDIENLDIERKTTLLRIVQEQLKNIIWYSKSNMTVIDLCLHRGEVKLSIKDNGIGFDPDQITSGIGLSNIYDRVKSLNGSADLQTAMGKGCVLSVCFPVSNCL
jgi:two-component system sensor histidine kinase UhpB